MPIRVFKCAHLPDELNEKFAGLFRWCDILLLEDAANDGYEEKKERINCLSSNKPIRYILTPTLYEEFKLKLEDSFIKGSFKQIELEHSPFSISDMENLDEELLDAQFAYYSGRMDDAISKKIDFLSHLTDVGNERDRQLSDQLRGLAQENPDKNILAIFGSDHCFDIFLNKSGIPVERTFSHLPLAFNSQDEIQRKMRSSKHYSTELVARTFPEIMISGYLLDIGNISHDDVVRKVRGISERLSYEDIKSLSVYIAKNSGPLKNDEEVYGCTFLWLSKRGITI